jgi:hypothetical protein
VLFIETARAGERRARVDSRAVISILILGMEVEVPEKVQSCAQFLRS